MSEAELNPAAAPVTQPQTPASPQDASKPVPFSFGNLFNQVKQQNNLPNQVNPSGPVQPSPQIGRDALPQNLKKIEKF
jgi:hypothetical protein